MRIKHPRFPRGIAYPVLVAAVLLLMAWAVGLRINTTPSMPVGVYRDLPDGPLARHELVRVCLVPEWSRFAAERGYIGEGSCPDDTEPLLKEVAGLPGDAVDIDTDGIRINGELQPHSQVRHMDSRDRAMRSALKTGYIPDGHVLLLSPAPLSFDGRYFGLIPVSRVRRVRALFTF